MKVSPQWRRLQRVLLVVVTALVPLRVSAQIKLEKADPGDGVKQATAPTAIRFWFSEAPAGKYTRVKLTDSMGYMVYLSPPRNFDNDERAIAYPIAGRLLPGLYHVSWTSEGADSTLRSGKFSFHVLPVDSSAAQMSDTGNAKPLPVRPDDDNGSAATTAYSIARALSYAMLVIIIGASVFRSVIVTRTRTRGGVSTDPDIEAAMAWRAAAACAVFLFIALIRLFLQHRIMVSGLQGNTVGLHLGFMGLATRWGTVWLVQCGLVVFALASFLLAHWRIAGAWIFAGLASGALVLVSPMGAHAGATQQNMVQSVIFEALHLAGVAGWLGSLFWLAVAGLPVLRNSGEARARRVADLVHAFSPVALGSAALLTMSGGVSAWLRLGSGVALWTTSYGIALIVKVVTVLIIAGVSDYNWQRARPALGRRGASAQLAGTVKVELMVSVLVILATAVLAGLPSPSR
ncbi:MAG: copper resistance protein [Gemmatimonadetes bacterium]|nr:copper resistance protein [Gemmatimonadota bacterium]